MSGGVGPAFPSGPSPQIATGEDLYAHRSETRGPPLLNVSQGGAVPRVSSSFGGSASIAGKSSSKHEKNSEPVYEDKVRARFIYLNYERVILSDPMKLGPEFVRAAQALWNRSHLTWLAKQRVNFIDMQICVHGPKRAMFRRYIDSCISRDLREKSESALENGRQVFSGTGAEQTVQCSSPTRSAPVKVNTPSGSAEIPPRPRTDACPVPIGPVGSVRPQPDFPSGFRKSFINYNFERFVEMDQMKLGPEFARAALALRSSTCSHDKALPEIEFPALLQCVPSYRREEFSAFIDSCIVRIFPQNVKEYVENGRTSIENGIPEQTEFTSSAPGCAAQKVNTPLGSANAPSPHKHALESKAPQAFPKNSESSLQRGKSTEIIARTFRGAPSQVGTPLGSASELGSPREVEPYEGPKAPSPKGPQIFANGPISGIERANCTNTHVQMHPRSACEVITPLGRDNNVGPSSTVGPNRALCAPEVKGPPIISNGPDSGSGGAKTIQRMAPRSNPECQTPHAAFEVTTPLGSVLKSAPSCIEGRETKVKAPSENGPKIATGPMVPLGENGHLANAQGQCSLGAASEVTAPGGSAFTIGPLSSEGPLNASIGPTFGLVGATGTKAECLSNECAAQSVITPLRSARNTASSPSTRPANTSDTSTELRPIRKIANSGSEGPDCIGDRPVAKQVSTSFANGGHLQSSSQIQNNSLLDWKLVSGPSADFRLSPFTDAEGPPTPCAAQ